MGSLNKATVLGRLGHDPELRYTPAGTPVARSITEIVAARLVLLDGRGRDLGEPASSQVPPEPQPEITGEDIPF